MTPVAGAREAVKGVDILASCTDSMSPTFGADWLEPGMHVTMLGPRELSSATLDRFDVKIRQHILLLRLRPGEPLAIDI